MKYSFEGITLFTHPYIHEYVRRSEKASSAKAEGSLGKCTAFVVGAFLSLRCSQNMITYIETGKRTPTLTTLLKLCNALNITPAVLFADSSSDVKTAKATVIELVNRYMN